MVKTGIACIAALGCALALPTAVSAFVGGPDTGGTAAATAAPDFMVFTPAGMDPALVRDLAARVGVDALRFTPAARPAPKQGEVTIAVRIDERTAKAMTARAVSVRKPAETVSNAPRMEAFAVAPTRYDLGLARGYQGFARTERPAIAGSPVLRTPTGVRNIAMPDLSEYRPAKRPDEPGRFQPRIALDKEVGRGRRPGALDQPGEQSVEVGGSYAISGKVDVTAGVRLSQDRDRLNALTDGVEDDQAVYVGTQIRF